MSSYKKICLYSMLLMVTAFHVALCDRFSWLYSLGLQFFFPKRPDPPSPAVQRCPPNETFRAVGAPCGKSCGTYGQQCPLKQINRCQCLVGYARNRSGACIYHLDCPLNLDLAEFLDFL